MKRYFNTEGILKDVFFFCVDGLLGFKEAIEAVYPQAQIQQCVIFQGMHILERRTP